MAAHVDRRMRRAPRTAIAVFAVAAACAAPAYSPCPLDAPRALDDEAFARCRDVLRREFGALAHVDRTAFRLQSDWQPTANPPGERRASVFPDPSRADALAVVVELRRLTVPWIGPPHWTEVHGDPAAERELADRLREALMPDEALPGQ